MKEKIVIKRRQYKLACVLPTENILSKYISIMCVVAVMLMTSCEDFTDIQPKGVNLLDKTSDLELLLNTDAHAAIPLSYDNLLIGSNTIYAYSNIVSGLYAENKTRNAILYGYFDDEFNLNRLASLTNSDYGYTAAYSVIGRVCNPVLSQLPYASGTDAEKKALKAEALTARAFFHYYVLQRFAAAYNGSNGDEPAIIYMTEDKDIKVLQKKNTISECYNQMLKDINEAIELNSLPIKAINNMRWDQASAQCVKALILMGMHQYTEAEAAAKEALSKNSYLIDYHAEKKDAVSLGKIPYQYILIDDRRNEETLFNCPSLNYYKWVSPNEWDALEADYGKRALAYTIGRSRAGYIIGGNDYGDGGKNYGLSGWQSVMDMSNYLNVGGLSTPQLYLIIAECELRNGNVDQAMEWLDNIRAKRMPEGFTRLRGNITQRGDAIEWIKKTVVAEFLWTNWTYVWRKRWNTESEWETTITHVIDGQTFTLRPNSKLWISPFPLNAVEQNANLTNNW